MAQITLDQIKGTTVSVYWEEGFNKWFEGIIEAYDLNKGTISIYYPDVNLFKIAKLI
jgi:hypothetical protein